MMAAKALSFGEGWVRSLQTITMQNHTSRRRFLKKAGVLSGAALINGAEVFAHHRSNKIFLAGHVWAYASRYPPNWDCTPILDAIFSDMKYAGLNGIEIMESLLHHEDAVQRFKDLIGKHNIPVIGTSYYNDMWDESQQKKILEDVELTVSRLHQIGATMLGISVGDAGREKTGAELDVQADLLKKIMVICAKYNVVPNLHNHTYEMAYNQVDFKSNITRVPEIKLGPDLNWLVRSGVDPVWFINTYGHRMVFMHIRDQDAAGKWTETVGSGTTNFKAIGEALQKIHYKGRAAIELAFDTPPKNEVREDFKASRAYVQQTFGWS